MLPKLLSPLLTISISKWQISLDIFDLFVIIMILYTLRRMTRLSYSTDWANDPNLNRKPNNRFTECPLNYPNGWLPVLESSELKANQIKSVFGFGNDLVAFRVRSGKVCVLNAFCPHLGANLAFGGTVTEDHIRCPFHGWVFGSDGTCIETPQTDISNTPKVKTKVWESIEVNGFVLVWHHSKGIKPNWFPKPVPQIEEKGVSFKGKCEHIANCHIQEIVENGADLTHFSQIHNDSELFGSNINNHNSVLYKYFGKILKFDWKVKWRTSRDEQHVCEIKITFTRSLFGYTLIRVNAFVRQIGAAHLNMKVDIHCLGTSSLKDWISCKYALLAMNMMVERDLVVLNNKKYLKTPFLAKNESSLKAFRRWFSQFYEQQE